MISRKFAYADDLTLLHSSGNWKINSASEWTNHKWKTEYYENASRLRAFMPRTGARPVGMGLPRAGLSSIACGLVLGDSIRPCTNEVSLIHRIASVAPLSKPQTMF